MTETTRTSRYADDDRDTGVSAKRAAPRASGAGVLPYCGDRPFEHFGPGTGPHRLNVYASDNSGTKTYEFNKAGFRGETLNASAPIRVFVCGASYAFGTGLDLEETWSYRLKLGLASELGLEPNDVNVLNFSQSLASANYVTRTLLGQCSANRPDLVIANYSDMKRAEFFLDGTPVGVLPHRYAWHRRLRALRPGWQRRLFRWLPGLRNRDEAKRRLEMWDRYAHLYSREGGIVNTLTNILLLQSFCQAQNIDCMISWIQHTRLDDPRLRNNPAIAPLIDLLDPACFCPFSIVDDDICTDLAADDIHPGVVSNQAFADRLLETYISRRGRQHAEAQNTIHASATAAARVT